MGPRRARRHRLLPGAGAGALRPRRRGVVRPELPGRLLPVFVLDAYEGLEPRLLQELTADERERYVTANAAALYEHLPADLVFCEPRAARGPVGAATGARFAVKAHGSELEYSIRGRLGARRGGARRAAPAEAVFVGSGHIRGGAGGRRRAGRGRPRSAARRRRGGVRPAAPRRGAARPARRVPPRPAEPGQRERAAAGRGERRAARALPRRGRADGPLLREAALQQGRPPAARGDARARRARRSSSASATTASELEQSRRRARCSPGSSSTATSST